MEFISIFKIDNLLRIKEVPVMMKILNSRRARNMFSSIKGCYGIEGIDINYSFLLENDKLFIINKDFINLSIRFQSIGLYFGRVIEDGIVLSVEASQILGNFASNVVEFDKKEIEEWLHGNDIKFNKDGSGYFIIKHKNDYFGVGKLKDSTLFNLIPKSRRIYNISSGSTPGI